MCRPTPSRSSWESVADVGDATTNGPSTGHSGGTAADLHCLPYSSAAVRQRTPAPLFARAIKRAALKSVKSAPFQKQFSQHLFLLRSLFSAEYSGSILLVQLLIMADESLRVIPNCFGYLPADGSNSIYYIFRVLRHHPHLQGVPRVSQD